MTCLYSWMGVRGYTEGKEGHGYTEGKSDMVILRERGNMAMKEMRE